MKTLQKILLIIFVLYNLSCNRPHPKACFTVSKTTANIGDTIYFTNCSYYDGGSTFTEWYFGDTNIINNGENVQHIYKIAGQYVADIKIGSRSHGDSQSKIITIQ